MSKKQSFAEKAKAKVKSEYTVYRCVFSVYDEEKGSWKFRERIVSAKDPAEITKLKGEVVP
ncbi:MAG: hypothetical protein QHI48_04815 [Bacteroidota bacterium]|nr:hypothetical protein [Bacteroidota bacterium]